MLDMGSYHLAALAQVAENAMEKVIRQVSLLAHAADNNATSGPAFKALFLNGLDAELRPIGPTSGSQGEGASHGRLRLQSNSLYRYRSEGACGGVVSQLAIVVPSPALDAPIHDHARVFIS
jgi:hypothetical protein